jgi:hypothetical protein
MWLPDPKAKRLIDSAYFLENKAEKLFVGM